MFVPNRNHNVFNGSADCEPIDRGLYQSGSGGEFAATIFDGGALGFADGHQFQTFCVEHGETLSFGSTYDFFVNDGAVNGGLGGQDPSGSGYDPLDSRTAWLYNEFTKGTAGALASTYDFDGTESARQEDAGQLQQALWFLEDELGVSFEYDDLNSQAQNYVDMAGLSYWFTDGTIGDIRIMNLYNSDGSIAQDVLVKITPAAVPAPGALLLSGLGTLVAGYLRKRRSL